jgi:hypothetical protein
MDALDDLVSGLIDSCKPIDRAGIAAGLGYMVDIRAEQAASNMETSYVHAGDGY